MATRQYSHRERIERCFLAERSDAIPVALWRHFPGDDQHPLSLAAATAAFQHQFDFDLIKITPASSFSLKDWGARDEWKGSNEGTREYAARVIHSPDEWEKLQVLDPQLGNLQNQLLCIRALRSEFPAHTPLLQTIFNPLAQAKNLVGKDALLFHMRQNPEALHVGLKIITESTIRFLEEAIKLGIDGIFYAIQHAQLHLITQAEFNTFSRPYDLQILRTSAALWCNMLHLHGENVMFECVCDYPVQILNWHDRQTLPTLQEGKTQFSGTVCGGLRQWDTMLLATPDQVIAEARDAILQTEGRRFILGTGCVLPITTPYGNILAATQVARQGVIV